jgi:hypothetical protein
MSLGKSKSCLKVTIPTLSKTLSTSPKASPGLSTSTSAITSLTKGESFTSKEFGDDEVHREGGVKADSAGAGPEEVVLELEVTQDVAGETPYDSTRFTSEVMF